MASNGPWGLRYGRGQRFSVTGWLDDNESAGGNLGRSEGGVLGVSVFRRAHGPGTLFVRLGSRSEWIFLVWYTSEVVITSIHR